MRAELTELAPRFGISRTVRKTGDSHTAGKGFCTLG